MNVVEAWWPVTKELDNGVYAMCSFYYVIINEIAYFVGHKDNPNGMRKCSYKDLGFDHSRITPDLLRNGDEEHRPYYPLYVKGYLNIDTGEFHAS